MDNNNGGDKYKAVWVSHSSIGDYLKCPRLYYLRNVYKDPKTGRKVTITNPYLALGGAVHEVVESLSDIPAESRFSTPFNKLYELVWPKYSGKLGGFSSIDQEKEFKDRGLSMLSQIEKNPGLLKNKAIKIKTSFIPNYWLSAQDNIILCGKIDWIEYLPDTDSVHIVDFKTGKNMENDSSLQLPIYLLLSINTQNRNVQKASYWYLDPDIEGGSRIEEKELPDAEEAHENVFKIASRIKLARQLNRFVCPKGGCRDCIPYEDIVKGKGERVGVSGTNQDVYIP